MKLLALDTTARSCSVAVVDDIRLVVELSVDSGATHSIRLMSMVDEALRLAAMSLDDLDAFGVSLGPGSFTGLRIGISTVQGLAFATGKPCHGVSSLDALAYGCLPWPQRICALLDARKDDVYTAVYRSRGLQLERIGDERVLPVAAALDSVDGSHLYVGDGAWRYRDRIVAKLGETAAFAGRDKCFPRASATARLAQRMAEEGAPADLERLIPRYIRASDAELTLLG
jgi:tRNA threonylcarbamoyladenosine biosynthesis protein TsaB